MSINLIVVGRAVKPHAEDMYDYLSLIPRYEQLEVRGKIQAVYHTHGDLHCAFIVIDAMVALNDHAAYFIILTTPDEQKDPEITRQVDHLWRAAVKWSEGKTTFVQHYQAATLAIIEPIRAECFAGALNQDTFVLRENSKIP